MWALKGSFRNGLAVYLNAFWLQALQRRFTHPIEMAFASYESKETDENAYPLIVMHNMLASKMNWKNICQSLEPKLKRKIYSVDARNHGDSPHSASHSIKCMTSDLLKFMLDQKISKALVLGDGMGGVVMMHFAFKHPQLVERGVIVDLSPLSMPRGLPNMLKVLFAMKYALPAPAPCSEVEKGRAEIEQKIKESVSRPEVFDFIISNLGLRDGCEFFWTPNVDSIHGNFKDFTNFMIHFKSSESSNETPMMFLCDNHSSYVNTTNWPTIKLVFPTSEIHWLNVNQLMYLHQSDHCLDLLVRFLGLTKSTIDK